MTRTRRNLWLHKGNYRRLADGDTFLTPSQLLELLLTGYIEGHIGVTVPERASRAPGRGRVVVALDDDVFARVEAGAGEGRTSLVIDTLIEAYLAGGITITLHATTDATQRAATLTVEPVEPPAENDAAAA
ncbi:hypothetical protein [Streptomyces katrae]|uniref:Uncharacterized protein n=1 Tax=Streptomyces katrae TaxID=68223 RepID=A0A0F4IYT7_9ACTN|nr:hypothetical protein [Streptomyces katrae]KJY26824.1 hypothetical protein VR44_29135 [Streptomyces katrae]